MSRQNKLEVNVIGLVLILVGSLISHASNNGYGILILGIGWYCLGYCAGKPTQRGEVISGS